jgi:hypothetical protein
VLLLGGRGRGSQLTPLLTNHTQVNKEGKEGAETAMPCGGKHGKKKKKKR